MEGVLGRMLDELRAGPGAFGSAAYSIAGNTKVLEGETVSADMISARSGAVRSEAAGDPNLERHVRKVLAPESTGALSETIASLFDSALQRSDVVGSALDDVTLTATFADDSLSAQFRQEGLQSRGRVISYVVSKGEHEERMK